MVGKWDRQLAHDFVKKYVELDVLWNVNNPYRKNPKARKKAQIILQQLVQPYEPDFSLADVCNKIKGFRATYLMELKRIQNSKNQAYIPTLSWFEIMDNALHQPVMDNMARKLRTNYSVSSMRTKIDAKSDGKKMQIVHEDEENPSPDEYDNSLIKIENEEMIETCYSPVNVQLTAENELHSNKIDYNLKTNKNNWSNSQQSQNSTSQISSTHIKASKPVYEELDDEFTVFGKSVAIQLRKLPLNQALKAQLDIQTLLINARLKMNNGNESNASNASNVTVSSVIDSTTNSHTTFSHL